MTLNDLVVPRPDIIWPTDSILPSFLFSILHLFILPLLEPFFIPPSFTVPSSPSFPSFLPQPYSLSFFPFKTMA